MDTANLVILIQRGKEFYRFVAHGPTYEDVVRVAEHTAHRESGRAPEDGMFLVSVCNESGDEVDCFQGWKEDCN